ncbi:hypothetical protein ACX8XK_23655 [Serratia marcescens]|uniref:hypothetical protein n=1 Tax=Serratia sarumanii TaxID=3020826 RepID=UPI003F7D96A5
MSKLSELSKPVMYSITCNGVVEEIGGDSQGFVREEVQAELDSWGNGSVGIPDGYSVSPLYSQEYVSALLADNEYMRWRIKEIDLLFGQMLLTMQAAVIEIEHGEGPNAAMAWIVNKLAGPGEFAPDSEKDAQAYFNRESEKIDVEYSKCMEFFEARRKAMKEQSNG